MAPPTVAWAALTAAETADFAADKPLAAVNALRLANSGGGPTTVRWNDEGTVAGADHTLSTAPCLRAYDGYPGFVTSPDATADNEWYLVFDLGAAGVSFDSAFIIGHNFGTLALTTVQIQVADSADFATNLRTVADFGSPADDTRLADYDLHHTGAVPLRYSDTEYVRLKLANGGGANFTPSLRELVLGYRYQFDRKPDRPWDELSYARSYDEEESESGIDYQNEHWDNRLVLDAEWPVESTAYVTGWRSFWAQCRGSFVWNDAPSSAGDSWRLMTRKQTEIEFPLIEGTQRMARLVAREQGPSQYYLGNE